MNTNRLLAGLAVAVVVAFVLSVFVYRQFKKAATAPHATMQTLVVAARPLPIGTRLDANNTRLIPWPSDQPVVGMFTRQQDCANRAVLTDIVANEPILDSKLAPLESGAGLPATIPEGMRAISVAVNEVVGVAGFVTPGTMVDVLVTGRRSDMAQGPTTNITKTILENVKVLAAGQRIEQDRDGKPQTVPVITLLVTPDQASILAMGSTEGKIQLALRNTIDTDKTNPAPVLEATLFAPAPEMVRKPGNGNVRRSPGPPPAYVVEVITGSKHESKSFPQ